MQRRILVLILGSLLALGLAACSSSSKSSNNSSSSSGSGGADITIQDFNFGGAMAVKAGATVTVKNNGPSTHTVTADNNEFNTGDVDPGKTVTFTAPSKAGQYKFHCSIHTQMTAVLHVT
jgi:plastocyanin